MKKNIAMKMISFCLIITLLFNPIAAVSASTPSILFTENYCELSTNESIKAEPMFVWKAPAIIWAAKKMLGTSAIRVTGSGVTSVLYKSAGGANAVKFVAQGGGAHVAFSYRLVNGTFIRMSNAAWNWDIASHHPIPLPF